MNKSPQSALRSLPAVNAVLAHPSVRPLLEERGREAVLRWVREELDAVRADLLGGEAAGDRPMLLEAIAQRLTERSLAAERGRIGRVINATGVILHTGLGRAPLSEAATGALAEVAGASNVEIDLETNRRRYRGHQLESAWSTLTGCEDSIVLNNNAAATLLTLQALCAGREVVISRGQLIEIGGSFRLPEIFALSGARLREVGTTNRTRLADYEQAIGPETAALMHVHPSNYRVVGFTTAPEIDALAHLAREKGLIAIDDIGSGSFVDVTRFGLPPEPTFRDSLQRGADVVLGSGDKLLGGPQAGVVLGRANLIERIRRHPLARAVRVDKLTLAAMAATLDSYLRGTAETEIPTLAMLAAGPDDLRKRAEALRRELDGTPGLRIEVETETAPVGGGSLPGVELPTAVLAVTHDELSAEALAHRLRVGSARLCCRVHDGKVVLDLRSVLPGDDSRVAPALRQAAGEGPGG